MSRPTRGRLSGGLGIGGLAIGAVLVLVAAVSLSHDRAAPTAFGPPPVAEVGMSPAPSTTAAAAGRARKTTGHPVSGAPVELVIPSLRLTAPIDPVAVTAGSLDVPEPVTHVGWWRRSVSPGATAGTTVIDGHVDSARAGIGALFGLERLRSGDTVLVRTAVSSVSYRVYARQIYAKAPGLPPALFDQRGPARLVLISCGGPFDQASHSYADNIAVFAAPVPR